VVAAESKFRVISAANRFLEGVGQDMLAVPIKAECLVPKVKVFPSDFLEYETCFLRHPKT
jgi:hydrocephalus-inducing protein